MYFVRKLRVTYVTRKKNYVSIAEINARIRQLIHGIAGTIINNLIDIISIAIT